MFGQELEWNVWSKVETEDIHDLYGCSGKFSVSASGPSCQSIRTRVAALSSRSQGLLTWLLGAMLGMFGVQKGVSLLCCNMLVVPVWSEEGADAVVQLGAKGSYTKPYRGHFWELDQNDVNLHHHTLV